MTRTRFVARSPRGWLPGGLSLGRPSSTVVLRGEGVGADLSAVFGEIARHLRPIGRPTTVAPVFPVATLVLTYEFGRHLGFGGGQFHPPTAPDEWTLHAAIHTEADPATDASACTDGPNLDLRERMQFAEYARRVESIKEGIRAGALYQANLAVPFGWSGHVSAEALFERGLALGGADFAALVPVPGGTVVCFSPELFLRVRGRSIETRPIKGTRALPPGDAGAAAIAELLASEKERAEHTMIVDLERNDLGRLCEPGSVHVDPCMEAVRHPTVVHLESTVRGVLREDAGVEDVLRATFPGGSISGAPKRAALEWIRRLEDGPRGVFCGALGWMDSAGNLELALPIRTAVVGPGGGVFHAGGGITIDSEPAAEWSEVMAKAAFFRRVLGGAPIH